MAGEINLPAHQVKRQRPSANGTTNALNHADTAAGGTGAACNAAGDAAATGVDTAATGWAGVTAALADYASKARDIGSDIGQTLVGTFQSAEDALANFVTTGKLSFGDLMTSILADLAKLAARRLMVCSVQNGRLRGRPF